MITITQFILAQVSDLADDNTPNWLTEINRFKVLQAIVVVLVTYWGQSAIEKIIIWISEKVPLQYRLTIKQSLPFCRAFLLGLAGIILINLFLDLSTKNLIAFTGTIAVALGFAFKDYVSSIIAGIIALFERPYQVGDRVKIDEHYGEIISYGLRGILIRTPSDDIVTIPHNKIWTEAILNTNKGNVEAQTVVDFYFGHEIDVEKFSQILYRVAQTSKYTQLQLPILVVMDNKPWGTHFKLKCYPIDARDEFIYKTDLIKRAKRVFSQYKLSYPRINISENINKGND